MRVDLDLPKEVLDLARIQAAELNVSSRRKYLSNIIEKIINTYSKHGYKYIEIIGPCDEGRAQVIAHNLHKLE